MKRHLWGAAAAAVGLLALSATAGATTVNLAGTITSCTPTCLSFDFLDVGSEVSGFLEFGAGFDDGTWNGGDVTDLSFVVFNPAVPASPSNPTVLDPTSAGSAVVVANGQMITNPRGTFGPPIVITSAGTQDGMSIDSGLMDLWLTEGVLAGNGAVVSLDFNTGTFNVNIFVDLGGVNVASGTFTTEISSVPVPAAAWLLGSALFGLLGLRRRA